MPSKNTAGVFGGSFDPFHAGHAGLISQTLAGGLFAKIFLVPARRNPLKTAECLFGPRQRLEMLNAEFSDEPRVEVIDWELNRDLPSFTYDTLLHLRNRFPGFELSLMMGSDTFSRFHLWKNPEAISRLAPPTVYARKGQPAPDASLSRFPFRFAEFNLPEISSTQIRSMLAAGENVDGLIPEKAWGAIQKNRPKSGFIAASTVIHSRPNPFPH